MTNNNYYAVDIVNMLNLEIERLPVGLINNHLKKMKDEGEVGKNVLLTYSSVLQKIAEQKNPQEIFTNFVRLLVVKEEIDVLWHFRCLST